MRAKIIALNRLFLSGEIDRDVYKAKAETLLRPYDWQKRIQYHNMLYV